MKLKRPKLRKVNTAKRKKERKAAEAALRRATSAMLDMPSGCCVCEREFDRNQETVKTWQVVVKGDDMTLTCPECWDATGGSEVSDED